MSRQRSSANIKVRPNLFSKTLFFVLYHLMLSGKVKAWKILVQGIYLDFVGSARDVVGFRFLPPFDHPRQLKCELPRYPAGEPTFSVLFEQPLSTRVEICLVLVDWDTYNAIKVIEWRGVILAL